MSEVERGLVAGSCYRCLSQSMILRLLFWRASPLGEQYLTPKMLLVQNTSACPAIAHQLSADCGWERWVLARHCLIGQQRLRHSTASPAHFSIH